MQNKIIKKIARRIFYIFFDILQLFISRKSRWTSLYKNLDLIFTYKSISSKLPINVVIPAAEKDFEVLRFCLEGVRRNIKHPISKIIIISSESKKIIDICSEFNCEFVNENNVTNFKPDRINLIVRGVDLSKWMFQQFLKLNGDNLSSDEHFLVVDSDTVFIRPQVFEYNKKMIFNFSDEYHQPYFDIYKLLTGEFISCPVSFTSHQMLFKRSILKELKNKIELENQCNWQQAILNKLNRNESSGHSDYDTYGQYAFLHYRDEILLRYWFNFSLKRDFLEKVNDLEVKYAKKFKSISFHSYNK